jgi:hypothetical protein
MPRWTPDGVNLRSRFTVFDHPQAERKTIIEPDCMLVDFGGNRSPRSKDFALVIIALGSPMFVDTLST